MRVIRTSSEMRAYRRSLPRTQTIGFVPTMGGLHEGHLTLVRAARENDVCIVSIYVNTKQFAADEDLATYPSTLESDLESLRAERVDAVYVPSEHEVYPERYATYVYPLLGDASHNKCSEGASRPTFFRGVATVMLNLLLTVRPNRLYCGQKDAQQCAVLRAMITDLFLRVDQLVVLPTVREHDGLAMSSRNRYLSNTERLHATVLFRAICRTRDLFRRGERNVGRLKECARLYVEHLWQHPPDIVMRLVYVSVCERGTVREILHEVSEEQTALVCIAGVMGGARLIDNLILCQDGEDDVCCLSTAVGE